MQQRSFSGSVGSVNDIDAFRECDVNVKLAVKTDCEDAFDELVHFAISIPI